MIHAAPSTIQAGLACGSARLPGINPAGNGVGSSPSACRAAAPGWAGIRAQNHHKAELV